MTVGAEGGRLVVARLCRGAASPVKKGGLRPVAFPRAAQHVCGLLSVARRVRAVV